MGIGRKEFLKLISLAMVGAAIAPSIAAGVNKDYYFNKKLGIIFQKPKDWGYVHIADFGELKKKQLFSNLIDDELEEFWETIGEPACIITKYFDHRPEHEGVFSPTIQFFVNHKSEFDDIEYESFEEFIEMSKEGTTTFLKDFEVLHEKNPYEVDGCLFYEYEGHYLFEHIELSSALEVRLNVIIIEHNNYYYYINFHDCPAQNQIATEEFQLFKESLRMV